VNNLARLKRMIGFSEQYCLEDLRRNLSLCTSCLESGMPILPWGELQAKVMVVLPRPYRNDIGLLQLLRFLLQNSWIS